MVQYLVVASAHTTAHTRSCDVRGLTRFSSSPYPTLNASERGKLYHQHEHPHGPFSSFTLLSPAWEGARRSATSRLIVATVTVTMAVT